MHFRSFLFNPSRDASGMITTLPNDKCFTAGKDTWCYDPAPKDKDKCVNIDGYFICKTDMKEKSFKQEVQRFKDILFYPKMRIDEAKKTEVLIIEFTIGFILSSLVFTLSYYIKDIIDIVTALFMPVSYGLISVIIIVAILILITIILALAQSRVLKASEETNVLEKLAEKTPVEGLNTVLEE
jgi:hypothetical protein